MQATLAVGRADLTDLHARVHTANELLQMLLQAMQDHDSRDLPAAPDYGWKREPAGELFPGAQARGLFWLDHFVYAAAQLNATFAPMIDRVGFRMLRWNTGRGKEKEKWYVSALLEKPVT
ncbi:unnamed protein product [Miscanthus lutarioriparius]|uniref:Uncharacterized protein n=1 Tax=Miscanthus lutarioriparius TaxID=422564 RepID=A0A811MV45_9POAL|nr:unnamed protein product [Miscanthus lutarioriparius]